MHSCAALCGVICQASAVTVPTELPHSSTNRRGGPCLEMNVGHVWPRCAEGLNVLAFVLCVCCVVFAKCVLCHTLDIDRVAYHNVIHVLLDSRHTQPWLS